MFYVVHDIEKDEHTWTNTSPLHIHHHCWHLGFARILSTNFQRFGIPGSQLHPGMPELCSRNLYQ